MIWDIDSQFLWVDSQFEGFRSQMRGIGSQRFLRDCVPYLGCWGNCLIINAKKFFHLDYQMVVSTFKTGLLSPSSSSESQSPSFESEIPSFESQPTKN